MLSFRLSGSCIRASWLGAQLPVARRPGEATVQPRRPLWLRGSRCRGQRCVAL
ncbi:hypothetical protein ACFFX0_05495 [Citricoccus parietis]|uniref:Uncharacterized protein n=1 Tax=Citricoccus parietis TaxID=592307 RepID=A0ABV5FVI4_9MICC